MRPPYLPKAAFCRCTVRSRPIDSIAKRAEAVVHRHDEVDGGHGGLSVTTQHAPKNPALDSRIKCEWH